MGQKDLAQNDYFNDKVRFADVCNGFLFQGKQIINANELLEAQTDIVYREGDVLHKVIPDKVHIWNGFCIGILGVENQTMVDYHMVFRIMKTEAIAYERQWKDRERELRRQGILNEKAQLCWNTISKEAKFLPIIMIVIYFGIDKPWDGATYLHDMLDMDKMLEPYVANYKINLFDFHKYSDFSFFRTENRELFEVLSCATDEEKMNKLLQNNLDRYGKLPIDVVSTIFRLSGIDLNAMKVYKEKEQEVVDMCKAWDDHMERGRKEGIEQTLLLLVSKKVRKNMTLNMIADDLEEDAETIRPFYEKAIQQGV